MSDPLDTAWLWYTGVRESALTLQRFGARYWDDLPWEGRLGRDNRLREVGHEQVATWTEAALSELDDLCVLFLFSVFEAVVRDETADRVNAEVPTPSHPALRLALRDLNDSISHGSFARVAEAYKSVDADLVEQVNQVRQFRNWVAHGRRGPPKVNITPEDARDRLERFLAAIRSPPATGPAT